jgi:hypothetical protein
MALLKSTIFRDETLLKTAESVRSLKLEIVTDWLQKYGNKRDNQ